MSKGKEGRKEGREGRKEGRKKCRIGEGKHGSPIGIYDDIVNGEKAEMTALGRCMEDRLFIKSRLCILVWWRPSYRVTSSCKA